MKNLTTLCVLTLALALGATAALASGGHAHHKPHRVALAVTSDGFTPQHLKVKRGMPMVLAITRKTDKTCATAIVVHVAKDKTVKRDLPLNETVEIPVTFAKAGELTFACGMGHLSGSIQVQ